MTINNKFQFSVVEQRMSIEQWTWVQSVYVLCERIWFSAGINCVFYKFNSHWIAAVCAIEWPVCAWAAQQHSYYSECVRATHAHQWINTSAFANHTFDVLRTRSLAVCVFMSRLPFCYSMNTKTTANTSFRHTFLFVRTHRVFSSPYLALRILMIWQ